ncbi:RyR domain protein [Nonomuraea sp. K274]|uniref:RyR domain protein n=1 Tax=Nonomuraea cypriaca TaxID=1187855 RepID=A0A931ABR6_9ACTN|nr:RyR domain-containing protein [Nonomuraea cypriaca]MBF8187199.1 RyR domain protein [Nonomuraea cypriaca]
MVRVDQRKAFGDAFRAARLMEDLAGTLRVFAVIEEAGEPELIDEDLIERLARAIHDRYVLDAARRGDLPGLNGSMTPWAELTEPKKEQNRRQAADIGLKLRAVGCVLAPSTDAPGAFPFSDAEVELLARMEHARWMKHHTGHGWTHGPERNEERKQHPDILDWNALPEESRDKDRATVRNLPDVLADAGFRIVRLTPAKDHQ